MKGHTLKKTIISALLITAFTVPGALAQTRQQERNAKAYKQLVDQYATATLGFLIEDRCRQLADVGYNDFIENQKILNKFMAALMGQQAWQNLLVGIDQTAQDATTNPCNTDTFKFAVATSQISSKMATRVQLLKPEDYPVPFEELPVAQAQNQGAAQPEQQTPAQPENQPESQPVEEPVDNTPPPPAKVTFEPVTTTQVTRQPETKKSTSAQTTTPQPEATPQSQPAQSQTTSQTTAQAGIPLSNYVNPYPYTAPPAPGGETEKSMKRRHRQEIIDLRRAQRAELNLLKDNQDNYLDYRAVKKAVEERHSAEYSAIRNRHMQELERF